MLHLLKLAKPLNKTVQILTNKNYNRLIRSSPINLWLPKRINGNTVSDEREKSYKIRDKIPGNYELIYRAPMETYINYSMHASTITAILISVAAMYQLINGQEISAPFIHSNVITEAEDIYYYTVAFIVLNIVLRYVVALCPIRIYKKAASYKNVYLSQIPGVQSQHTFNRGEVKKVEYYFNPWNIATYKMGTRICIVFEDYFKTPSEFNNMMDAKMKK